MAKFKTQGKTQLVRIKTGKNPFSLDTVIELSDLAPQKVFFNKYSSTDFSNLYEKKSKNPFSSYAIDCQEGFSAGENYKHLKIKKVKQQLIFGIIGGPGQIFMNTENYFKRLNKLNKNYNNTCNSIKKAEEFSDTISFELGMQKAKIELKEKLWSYAFIGSIGASLISAYYSQK